MQHRKKFGCGNLSLVGPVNDQMDRIAVVRALCKSYRCLRCLPRELKRMRARIAQIATEKKLQKLASLTLDPKKIPLGARSDRHLRETWRKMRVLLARRFGKSVDFIGVLEFQKSGIAHLHLLVAVYIPQDWLSTAWESVGGGKIVDIRFVDVQRIVGYLTRYLAGEKVLYTLSLLPRRARIFTSSRSISFRGPKRETKWWLCEHSTDDLRRHSWRVENERWEFVDFLKGRGRELLMYFESLFSSKTPNAEESL